MSERQIDKTALSYWFPKIEAAGLPVPKTKIVAMPADAHAVLYQGMNGEDSTAAQIDVFHSFLAKLKSAAIEMGLPCFLRTDHTSNKHRWKQSCYLTDLDLLPHHVSEIAEFSEICDIMGLPYSNWAVREFLPTIPFGICPDYSDMPICREFRFFVDGGTLICAHPYWPHEALEQGGVDMAALDYNQLCRWPHELKELAETAGNAVGGAWSVDILETKRGWYVTDMAEAHKSFHWQGCPQCLALS